MRHDSYLKKVLSAVFILRQRPRYTRLVSQEVSRRCVVCEMASVSTEAVWYVQQNWNKEVRNLHFRCKFVEHEVLTIIRRF